MANKNSLKAVLFVLGLIFSQFAFAAFTVTAPTLVTGPHFDISWSGGQRYVTLYESVNGSWSAVTYSVDATTYTYSIHYKPNGTYQYKVSSCYSTCEDIYKTVVVDINNPPTISSISAQTVNEDSSTGAVAFTVSDSDTSLSSLVLSGNSSNQTIIPNGNITFGGSGSSRTVTVVPAANQYTSGTPVAITVNVYDGRNNVATSFNVTVNPVNDAPTISTIPTQTINEDTPSSAIAFTVNDVDTAATSLTITGGSSNTNLISNSGIQISGTGNSRSVVLTPVTDANGTAVITLSASDGIAPAVSTSFTVNVTAVNDMPTITAYPTSVTINEDTSSSSQGFVASDPETSSASLQVSAVSNNTSIISSVTVSGSGPYYSFVANPAPNATGTTSITLKAYDGSLTKTVDIPVTVNAVNDAPTISAISTQTTSEDTASSPIAFTVADIDTAVGSLTVTGVSSNTSVVANAGIQISGTGASRSVVITPVGDANGSAVITLSVSDGVAAAVPTSFTINVTAVNDMPIITAYPTSVTINEDTPSDSKSFAVSDIDTPLASLQVSAISNDTSKIASVTVSGSGAYYSFVVNPAPNATGTGMITLKAYDGSSTRTVDIPVMISAVNDAPTISAISTQTTSEDTASSPIAFTVADIDTAVGSLTVTGVSSNTSVVANAGIQISGAGASRSVVITPVGDANGSAVITLSVSDGVAAAVPTSFTINVTAVNDMPIITAYPTSVTINEDTPSDSKSFAVSDIDTPLASLQVSAISNDTSKIASVTVSGSGAYYSFVVNPAPNATGTGMITLKAYDGSSTRTVNIPVMISAVNDAPTISAISTQTTSEDTASSPIAFTIGDVDSDVNSLTVTGSSSDTSIIANSGIQISGTGASRTLVLTPVADANGTAVITLSVSDGAAPAVSTSFTINVTAVNDAPGITAYPFSITTDEDKPSAGNSFAVYDIDSSLSSLQVSAVSNNTAIISSVTVSGSGSYYSVVVNPAPEASGTTSITIKVSDGSASKTVDVPVTVNAVNDVPEISDIADKAIGEDVPNSGVISFIVSDKETASASLNVWALSTNMTLLPNNASNIVLTNNGGTRTITLYPTGVVGQTEVTVFVSDGVSTASDKFIFKVNDILAKFTNIPTSNATGSYDISWAYGSGSIKINESYNDGPWVNISNGLTSGSGTLTLHQNKNGNFRYQIEDCATACTPGDTKTVTVNIPKPTKIPALSINAQTSTDGNYVLSWTTDELAASYELYENEQLVTNTGDPLATSKTYSAKITGAYTYKVLACNGTGCTTPSNTQQIKVVNPEKPGYVYANFNTSTAITTIYWPPASGATYYLVQQQHDGVWANAIKVTNAQLYAFPKLIAGGVYQYRVQSCGEALDYQRCNPSTTDSDPITVNAPGPSVILSAPSTNYTGNYTVTWSSSQNVTGYQFSENNNAQNVTGTSFDISGKTNGVYFYQIAACNSVVCTEPSLPYRVVVALLADMGAVAAAYDEQAGATSVSWSPVSGAAYYLVQQNFNGAPSGEPRLSIVPAVNFGAASSGGNYSYSVQPCVDVEGIRNCKPAIESNPISIASLQAPSMNQPVLGEPGSYTLSWGQVANAITYKLYEGSQLVAVVDSTQKLISGMSSGHYTYYVQACRYNSVLCGDLSVPVLVIVESSSEGSSTTSSSSTASSVPTDGTLYQAETATLSGASVATDVSGYSGTGYAHFAAGVAGTYVEWSVTQAEAGYASLVFGYGNGGSADVPMNLLVNGVATNTLTFSSTSTWQDWSSKSTDVSLNAGVNKIRVVFPGSAGDINIDYLRVIGYQTTTTNYTYDSAGRLIDTH